MLQVAYGAEMRDLLMNAVPTTIRVVPPRVEGRDFWVSGNISGEKTMVRIPNSSRMTRQDVGDAVVELYTRVHAEKSEVRLINPDDALANYLDDLSVDNTI